MPRSLLLSAVAIVACAGPTAAQTTRPTSSAAVQALARCRAVAEESARLACYDAAAASLVAAERSGEVVVVDREQARAARRQAFGFNLPTLDVFRPSVGDDESDRTSLVIARAARDGAGKWVLRSQDGQVWRQTDGERLSRAPRAGSRAEVRRAMLGSYLMNIDGQTAIRVRREQ